MTTAKTTETDALAQIEQLIEQGMPHFGVFDRVETVNYLDYHSYLLSGKAVSQWRKQLRANQFCFVQIVQPPYRVCVAVATLNWVTSSFCYLYNDDSDSFELVEALQPLKRKSEFNQSTYEGAIRFDSGRLSIDMTFTADALTLELDSRFVSVNATLARPYKPLAVCTPTGKTGWTYTQKETITQITGQMQVKSDVHSNSYSNAHSDVHVESSQPSNSSNSSQPQDTHHSIEFSNAVASLDWSLGYMRRITNWYWTCISAYLDNGQHLGLNLATGVNETGASENACWLDGKRHHLPAVLFKRGAAPTDPWRVYHQSMGWSKVQLELTFTPIRCYKKSDRLLIVDSVFEQWLGKYSGYIILDGETIQLHDVVGLAEDHYAKW